MKVSRFTKGTTLSWIWAKNSEPLFSSLISHQYTERIWISGVAGECCSSCGTVCFTACTAAPATSHTTYQFICTDQENNHDFILHIYSINLWLCLNTQCASESFLNTSVIYTKLNKQPAFRLQLNQAWQKPECAYIQGFMVTAFWIFKKLEKNITPCQFYLSGTKCVCTCCTMVTATQRICCEFWIMWKCWAVVQAYCGPTCEMGLWARFGSLAWCLTCGVTEQHGWSSRWAQAQ